MDHISSVSRFGRGSFTFAAALCVDQVRFSAPSGQWLERPVFEHKPAQFRYDHHGYEELVAAGETVTMARFTPTEEGVYRFQALRGGDVVEEGQFTCLPSQHPGYVQVSAVDPRYFATTNGESYCAIGVNLCGAPTYPLPRGMEHFEVGSQNASLGLHEYRRWFRLLADNGGNYTRIWLSNAYFQTEADQAGQTDPLKFNRLDGLIELAREYGIRLKLCFDHFRAFRSENPVTKAHFMRTTIDPTTGREAASMDEWLNDPQWRDLWFQKARAYLARYGGDPVVMAWELWNEMDCIEGSWEPVREWTRTMLARIKAQEPNQLVVQSLGSYDETRKQRMQDDLRDMPEMDFQQVHRYLDQGAPWEICTLDPVAFSIQSVQATRRPDRPILLAETGAVNDRHTGPFRYYRMDNRGIIFHDTTFPAFFAGAGGSGHNWFWDSYVDQKNLWGQLKPFADLLKGVALDQEGFEILDVSNADAWCLALKGKHTLLAWVRSRADSWHAVLRDEIQPPLYLQLTFNLDLPGRPRSARIASFWPVEEPEVALAVEKDQLLVKNLKYGAMIRIEY